MKSYAARMREAEKTTIASMIEDIIAEFAAILATHGFKKMSVEHDKDWETLTINFKDPSRKDEVCITCSYGEHQFSAAYYAPGTDYEQDEIEQTGLKRFQKKLAPWLDGLGWDCPVCEGQGEVFPDNECELDPIPCPHCQGSGKTRELVDTNKSEAA
jgi:hypothetical protein